MQLMEKDKYSKPENLKDEVWDQHLDWMDVMSKQVSENYERHLARVKEDTNRSESLADRHEEVLQTPHVTQSLFSHPKH